MPVYESPKPFHQKDMVDREIDRFAAQEAPAIADLGRVKVAAQVQDGIDRYRAQAANMSYEDFINEKHRSSRLGLMLARAGDPKPSSRCEAHAIVAGKHNDAVTIRAVLAWLKLRIDDPHNGCWLPKDWPDRPHMPAHLKNAVPHCRIHHGTYYDWLRTRISIDRIHNREQLIHTLKMVRTLLQSGTVPPEVMPKTGL